MLREAEPLGLSRSARLRLVDIIGSLESEELDRFRSASGPPAPEDASSVGDEERLRHSRY
jgi:hypothetical protein